MKVSRSLVVLLATLLGMGTTVSLGLWQLSRAQTKQDLFDTMQAREHLAPLSNEQLPCTPAQWHEGLQRVVHLRGYWLPQHTVFLDNRSMDGRAGRLVLTPLRLIGGACPQDVMLVQRGWVPLDARERDRVPGMADPAGEVSLTARLSDAPSRLMELGSSGGMPPGPIRQNVDITALSLEWHLAMRPGSVQQLSEEQPSSRQDVPLLRHWWKPQADVGKHQAYAAQWFAMAAVMLFLYGRYQWWRPRPPSSADRTF
jgi:surfeit locus 1 family protein